MKLLKLECPLISIKSEFFLFFTFIGIFKLLKSSSVWFLDFLATIFVIPGDISSCSFFIVLTLLSENSELKIKNVNTNNSRLGVLKILNRMNANIIATNKRSYKGETISDLIIKSKKNLKGINCPKNLNSSAIDEFLIIFIAAAKAKGVSTFSDLGELNKKESPRLNIAINFLKKIGVKVLERKII